MFSRYYIRYEIHYIVPDLIDLIIQFNVKAMIIAIIQGVKAEKLSYL